jgi:hypothetical protein
MKDLLLTIMKITESFGFPCRLPFEESQGMTIIFLIVILKDTHIGMPLKNLIQVQLRRIEPALQERIPSMLASG